MTFNSSQEITDPISILCQSYDDENDISWDYYCEGVWEDNFWDGDTPVSRDFICGSIYRKLCD